MVQIIKCLNFGEDNSSGYFELVFMELYILFVQITFLSGVTELCHLSNCLMMLLAEILITVPEILVKTAWIEKMDLVLKIHVQ